MKVMCPECGSPEIEKRVIEHTGVWFTWRLVFLDIIIYACKECGWVSVDDWLVYGKDKEDK